MAASGRRLALPRGTQMRLSLIIAAVAALAATSGAAASKTEPDKSCPSSHPVPVPYPPVQARGVDANGRDCTGHPRGGQASAGARDTPIKAHTGASAGEIRGPVSVTVK
jgi:hypothetical protein